MITKQQEQQITEQILLLKASALDGSLPILAIICVEHQKNDLVSFLKKSGGIVVASLARDEAMVVETLLAGRFVVVTHPDTASGHEDVALRRLATGEIDEGTEVTRFREGAGIVLLMTEDAYGSFLRKELLLTTYSL